MLVIVSTFMLATRIWWPGH